MSMRDYSPWDHSRLAAERPRRPVSCDGARPYGKESAAIWTGRNPPTLSPGGSHQAEEAYVEAFLASSWRKSSQIVSRISRPPVQQCQMKIPRESEGNGKE